MLKQHFGGKYDVIKYHWGMKVSPRSFEKRRDKFFFNRISERYTLREQVELFSFNLLANPNAWIGELSDADAIEFFRESQGRLKRASKEFSEDLENIVYYCNDKGLKFKSLFEWNESHPMIFKMLQRDVINYETFILIDSIGKFSHKWDMKDVVWSEYEKRISGFKNILDINKDSARKLFVKQLKELSD